MKSSSWITRSSLPTGVCKALLLRTTMLRSTARATRTRPPPSPRQRAFSQTPTRPRPPPPPQAQQPGDDPNFTSILDNPPQLVRSGRRHRPLGLLILAIMPVTAFALGTWQVQRLGWKTELLARLEDRIVREPLPLPPRVDPAAVPEFDYRRVLARGRYRHDLEMLVGPRIRDGADGYMVVTPLERLDVDGDGDGDEGGGGGGDDDGGQAPRKNMILVNRGWINKNLRDQRQRTHGLPEGEVLVEGLLRQPWKKNMFTPDNRPEKSEFYFPDVAQMAALAGSQPVWIEQTMEPGLLETLDMEVKGIPIGRPAEVNVRNNHAQYIFTW